MIKVAATLIQEPDEKPVGGVRVNDKLPAVESKEDVGCRRLTAAGNGVVMTHIRRATAFAVPILLPTASR